jgi:Recombination endonuclease VII
MSKPRLRSLPQLQEAMKAGWPGEKRGISPVEYDKQLKKQNGVCAICFGPPAYGRRYCADHCHKTNTQRGLLCGVCNVGLGHFQDDISLLKSAIKYLRKYQNKQWKKLVSDLATQ